MGIFQGLNIARGAKNLNHSQFADDTLLLGGASMIIATRFKTILDSFLDASGGDANHLKMPNYGLEYFHS
jgi:hypothetical protein